MGHKQAVFKNVMQIFEGETCKFQFSILQDDIHISWHS